jgi:hypothetical protein
MLAAGCGSGGSSSSSGGGGGSGGGGSMFPDRGGGESSLPPPSVKTARITFESATGEKCCVAIDSSLIPQGALLILADLPIGPGVVKVDFFPVDFGPTVPGIGLTCATNPASAGVACDPTLVASPSFESEPQVVNIIAGGQTNVEDLVINAVPFVVDFSPGNGETAANPVQFDFTVADAVTGVEPDSVVLEITVQIPDGPLFHPLTKRLPLTLTPCTDGTAQPCSNDGENLDLDGYGAQSAPVSLVSGPVAVRILALNQGDPPQEVDFTYGFEVATPGPTTEPTAAATPEAGP